MARQTKSAEERKAEREAKKVSLTLELVSLEDKTLTAQKQVADLSAARPTIEIGQALNKILRWTKAYKKPAINVYVGGQKIGEIAAPRNGQVDAFTKANMAIVEMINQNALFSTEEILSGSRVDNQIAVKLANAFGFKGNKVSAIELQSYVKSKTKALNVLAKFAKEDAELKVGIKSLPQEVQNWNTTRIEAAKEQKKLLAAATVEATAEVV